MKKILQYNQDVIKMSKAYAAMTPEQRKVLVDKVMTRVEATKHKPYTEQALRVVGSSLWVG